MESYGVQSDLAIWQDLYVSSKFSSPQQRQNQQQQYQNESKNNSIGYLQTALEESFNLTRNFFHWLSTFEDPRVDNWPLMSSSLPVLGLFAVYLIASNYGPTFMKTRKPFQLRLTLIVYNLYIALLNLWIASELVKPNGINRYEMRIANAVWWYFASKGFEFADTLFFVLRKKDRQLTFLHKYHHSSMFLVWWTAVRFVPGGSAIIPVVVNSFVHVLMYSYYGLSAIGPSITPYLWWKKYLTIVQLIQFFVGVSIGLYLIASDCQFTRWMQYVFSCYAFSFIILFGNFYLHEYTSRKKTTKETSNDQENSKKANALLNNKKFD